MSAQDTTDMPAVPPTPRQITFASVITTVMFLATFATILRVVSRICYKRMAWIEDGTMIVAWSFALLYTVLCVLATFHGLGLETDGYTPATLVETLNLILRFQNIHYQTASFLKITICFIYLRLADTSRFEVLCRTTIAFLWALSVTIGLVGMAPLFSTTGFAGTDWYVYGMSSLHLILDIWLLALPVKTLAKIQRPKRENMVLLIAFGMGALCCIASVLHIYYLNVLILSNDPVYDAMPVYFLSVTEVNVALVCASIPDMKFILTRKARETGQPECSRNGSGSEPYAYEMGTYNQNPNAGNSSLSIDGDKRPD